MEIHPVVFSISCSDRNIRCGIFTYAFRLFHILKRFPAMCNQCPNCVQPCAGAQRSSLPILYVAYTPCCRYIFVEHSWTGVKAIPDGEFMSGRQFCSLQKTLFAWAEATTICETRWNNEYVSELASLSHYRKSTEALVEIWQEISHVFLNAMLIPNTCQC